MSLWFKNYLTKQHLTHFFSFSFSQFIKHIFFTSRQVGCCPYRQIGTNQRCSCFITESQREEGSSVYFSLAGRINVFVSRVTTLLSLFVCLSFQKASSNDLCLFSGSWKHHHQQTSCPQHHYPTELSSSNVTPCDHNPSQTSHPSGDTSC